MLVPSATTMYILPCTGKTWTSPSFGLWSAILLSAANVDRDDGTVKLATEAEPFNVDLYSGYTVFTPPRTASSGIPGSFFSHSFQAVFWPGRKCGTWCLSVPPFSANSEPLQVCGAQAGGCGRPSMKTGQSNDRMN